MPLISTVPEIIDATYESSTEKIRYVMPASCFGTLEYMLGIKDTEVMKSWLCYVLGREFDTPRCSYLAVDGSSGRIIITLHFTDPWYMSQTSHTKYIEYGTLPNPSE
jgi:hypothetical protein